MRTHTCTRGGSVRTRCQHVTQHLTHSAGPARAVCGKSRVADSPRFPPCLQEPGAGGRQLPRQGHTGATTNEQQAAGRAPTCGCRTQQRFTTSAGRRARTEAARADAASEQQRDTGTFGLAMRLASVESWYCERDQKPRHRQSPCCAHGGGVRRRRMERIFSPPSSPANKKSIASVLFQTTHHVLAHSSDDGAVRQARAQLHGQKPRGRQLILRMPADLWGEASCSTPCAAQPPGSASRAVEAPW